MKRLLVVLMMLGSVACGAHEAEPAAEDCAGIAGGSAVVDTCGVCDGDGTSCLDCAGIPNGDDLTCADCAGVHNGPAVEDACGVCDGDGTSCLDCAGIPNGDAVEDACGVCDGDGPINGDESLCGFVQIEAGTFTMGSPEGEIGRERYRERYGADETQHQVILTDDFYMSDHEVTQAEWRTLIGNNPSGLNNGTCPTCPVEYVNWWEALHYANALSESEGLTACYVLSGCNENAVGEDRECTDVALQDGSGNSVPTPYECEGYRLPTEAEWEYAARSNTTTALYNGDITSEYQDPNVDAIAWYGYNSGNTTHPVKGKLPNAWGLYDMCGNVWELTWDWHGPYSDAVRDPTGPSSGVYRVLRGGGWIGIAIDLRVAARSFFEPDDRYTSTGFRLARTVH